MGVTEDATVAVSRRCRSVEKELMIQYLAGIQPHKHSAKQKKSTHTDGSKALNLTVSAREPVCWRLEGPGHCRQGHEIRNEICQSMEGIGDQSLRVEIISADALSNSHTKIDVETYPCNAYAGVLSIATGQVGVVMMVRV